MYDTAVRTIEKYNMLSKGDSIVAGISGGADSCALVHLLADLRCTIGLKLTAVHINHQIRGEEADHDEDYAKAFCESLGVEIFVYKCDVPSIAKNLCVSEEEAGRIVRYQKFNDAAKSIGANKISVAHNLNDRTETLIMNLCRGSGLRGLSGIEAVSRNIIRPLIECSRSQIERYCEEHFIDYCTDSTNLKNDYTRNKIRNILIPWLKENINPAADINIANTAALLREEEDFLEILASTAYERAIVDKSDNKTVLKYTLLTEENPVIRRRVIRAALKNLRPELKNLSRVHIEAADKILSGETGKKLNLPGGIVIKKSYGSLEILNGTKISKQYCYEIEPDKKYYISEIDRYLILSTKPEKSLLNKRKICTKMVDYGKIKGRIQLRTRQSGDTIGIKNGRKKLKELFIDEKIPVDKRAEFPLLACGNRIILAGNRLGQDFYVNDKTEKVLYIYFWEET
ncbi:tRNA(Ile)-lysidine synthase [Clostridiales bacterium]|nr:tRNA(Ile)-lysidine synthase [Clostridiales bacterium]